MPEARRELAHWVAMLLALGGLAPHVFFEVSHLLRKPMPPRIDARYLSARDALMPVTGKVGYVSDQDIHSFVGAKLFTDAQYALSPHLLIAGGTGPYVIVNLSNPSRMDAFCRERGLNPIIASRAGVALAMTREPK